MFIHLQRQLRRHPSSVVLVTFVVWWSLAFVFTYTLKNDKDYENEGQDETYSFQLDKGGVAAHHKRAGLRRERLSKREKYNLVMNKRDEESASVIPMSVLNIKENGTASTIDYSKKTELLSKPSLKTKENKPEKLYVPFSDNNKRKRRYTRHLSNYESEELLVNKSVTENLTGSLNLSNDNNILQSLKKHAQASTFGPPHDKVSADMLRLFPNSTHVNKNRRKSSNDIDKEVIERSSLRTLVTIVCDSIQNSDAYQRNIFQHQLDQAQTMLKSLVYFSSSSFRVIVITDSQKTFNLVLEQLENWPSRYRSRLHLERADLWIPKDENILLEMWRPCSWSKLFLHEALPHVDAAVYVDTDILFLGPPEGLWDILEGLAEPQAFAIGPDSLYDRHKHQRYAGSVGLSAGLLAVNFTRLRSFSSEYGGYTETIIHYKNSFAKSYDQDTLNALLADHPNMFLELGPQWMFCPSQCLQGVIPCCIETGVNVIHGFDASFVTDAELIFQVIYETLFSMSLESPASILLRTLEQEFFHVERQVLSSSCENVLGIEYMLTKHIRDLAAKEDVNNGA